MHTLNFAFPSSSAAASSFAPSSSSSSSSNSRVHIEVVDEEEYELEKQREIEEAANVRAKAIERERRQKQEAAAASSSPAASPSSSSSNDGITPLLTSLRLPAFFHSLHDTRIYEPAKYQALVTKDVPLFHRDALQRMEKLREMVSNASSSLSSQVTSSVLLTCLTFLLPALPPTPTMLLDPSHDLTSSDSASQPIYELTWQTNELAAKAVDVMEALTRMRRGEEKESMSMEGLTIQPAASSLVTRLSAPAMQNLISTHLSTILTTLRTHMRVSSNASMTEQANAPWKSAQHFPMPFVVTAVVAIISRDTLSTHASEILPLLLQLIDDHELRYKISGLASLTRLLQIVSASSFPSGIALVVLNSLKTCLSFKERPVIALSVPAYVQAYIVCFPVVLDQDSEEVVERLAIAEGLRDPPATQVMKSGKVSLAPPSSLALELRDRVGAQSQLLQTLLQECTFFTLSPSTENSFAVFIYAQSLLPALLYVGPFSILPHIQQLLTLLTSWCLFNDEYHQKAMCYAWQCMEALCHMKVVEQRMCAHLGKIMETAAQAWIQGVEARPTANKYNVASLSRGAQHPYANTIVSCLRRLQQLEPKRTEEIWKELRQVEELKSLDQAIR